MKRYDHTKVWVKPGVWDEMKINRFRAAVEQRYPGVEVAMGDENLGVMDAFPVMVEYPTPDTMGNLKPDFVRERESIAIKAISEILQTI